MRARMSMRWSITLFTGFFVIVSLCLVLGVELREAHTQWMRSSELHALTVGELLARASAEPLRRGDTPALNALVRQTADQGTLERVVLVGRDGRVISDSAPGQATPALLARTPALRSLPSTLTGKLSAQVLVPIRRDGETLGAVLLCCSFRQHQPMLETLLQRGLAIGVLIILAACAAAHAFAQVIATPLRRLARRMEAIAQGEPAKPLPEEGCCELRQMAQSFNHMTESLRRHTEEMASLPALGLAVSRSLDLPDVLQAAVESVERTLPDRRVQIWLRDSDERNLVLGGTRPGVDGATLSVPVAGTTSLARAYRKRMLVQSGRAERPLPPNRYFARQFGAKGLAVVPLSTSSRLAGVLAVYSTDDAPALQPEEQLYVSAAANQIASSIENARLYGRERRMASIFHRLLHPPATAAISGMEIATRWHPARKDVGLGGDYYDFIALPGGRWGIVIGDVCGKGTIAASYTLMARYVVRSYAYEAHSPSEILQRTNAALYAQVNGVDAEADAPMFVTMLCAIYDPETGRLSYAHAGHPLGTLVRADSRETLVLDCGGPPVGVLSEASYEEGEVYLRPGDTLALYTDGVVEAARSERLIEPERIGELVAPHGGDSVQDAADALIEEADRLASGASRDDVTVVVLRVGAAAHVSVPHLVPSPAELALR